MTTAVEAFSRTFLLRERRRTRAIARRVYNKLPVELLSKIFCLVYDDILQRCPWISRRLLEEDFTSASLFPYAFASVCMLWRDVMSLDPRFWQRIIIFIDDPMISFSTLSKQFSWSNDLHFDVVVARKKFPNYVDRQHERSQVAMVMKTINSHIHRIRELHFDIMFSSSLPSFPDDFRGTATMLKVLELHCKMDDGAPKLAKSASAAGTVHDFHCPQIVRAVIDGRNYYEASRRGARWSDAIAEVSDLSISRFQPRSGESFTVRELLSPLATLPDLWVVRICDLILSPSPADIQPLQPMSGLESLHFSECHNHRIMNEVYRLVGMPYRLSFVDCTFGGNLGDDFGAIGAFGHPGCLELTNINHQLAPPLLFWSGRDITLENCPRVDNIFLGALANETNGVFLCAPFLIRLNIHDCPNFSVAALRRLVEARLHLPLVPQDPNDWQWIPMRFQKIAITGNAPRFPPDVVAWFRENVDEFFSHECLLDDL